MYLFHNNSKHLGQFLRNVTFTKKLCSSWDGLLAVAVMECYSPLHFQWEIQLRKLGVDTSTRNNGKSCLICLIHVVKKIKILSVFFSEKEYINPYDSFSV